MLKKLYKANGFFGFYKGITASYFGISETIIHFVIYENIKSRLRELRSKNDLNGKESSSYYFIQFMAAGAISKTIASIIAYPHGKRIFYSFLVTHIDFKFFLSSSNLLLQKWQGRDLDKKMINTKDFFKLWP